MSTQPDKNTLSRAISFANGGVIDALIESSKTARNQAGDDETARRVQYLMDTLCKARRQNERIREVSA
jgi:hypothetical protein